MHDFNFLSEITIESENKNPVKKAKNSLNQVKNVHEKKKSKGGYRPVLVEESNLVQESLELKEPFELINTTCLINREFMSSQDICSYYLVVYLNQRYPNQLIENFNRIVDPNTLETCSDLVRTSKPLKDLNLKFKNKNLESKLNKLNINTLFDLVNSFNLHSVPYSARFTLVNWYLKNKFDLVLFINHIPSSKDVLCMQAQSKRCVSLIANKIDSLIMNERDPLSFLLHDLVHAYKMFSNDYLLKGQVGFSKAMLRIYQTEDRLVQDFLESLCSEDQTFSNDFDYLISDMNSHPKHLFFYFKAILINAFKRKFKIDFLAGQSLLQFDRIFESILDIFKMNDKQKELARRMLFEVNSTSCSNKDQTKPFNLIDFTF